MCDYKDGHYCDLWVMYSVLEIITVSCIVRCCSYRWCTVVT